MNASPAPVLAPPAPDPLPPDKNCGIVIIGASSALLFFVFATAGLRLYVRASQRNPGWDDYTIIASIIFGTVRWGLQVNQAAHEGFGRHRWYISEEQYLRNNMLGWWSQLALFASICLLKISILLLLLRMKESRVLRYGLWAAIAGLIITNGGLIIVFLAECRPVGYWREGTAKCWDPKVRVYSTYFTIAYSIVTDLLCSFLPLIVVWKVHILLRSKIMVSGLMSLGLVASGFGIVRASSIGLVTNDLSWDYAIVAIWANLELYLGQIAANLALARKVYDYFFHNNKSTSDSSATCAYRRYYLHSASHNQSHSIFAGHLRDPTGRLTLTEQETFVESRARSSLQNSECGEMPLERGIRKKTEFSISVGGRAQFGAASVQCNPDPTTVGNPSYP